MSTAPAEENSQRDTWLELFLNVVCPTVVLVFLSSEDRLGPMLGLVAGLSFPIAHASYSFIKTRKISPLSALAVVSVVLTGGIGLMKMDAYWFAVKEAIVPLVMSVFAAGSRYTPWPIVEVILWRLLDKSKVEEAMANKGGVEALHNDFDRVALWFAASFVYSAVVSFCLARYLVTSPTGSVAFNTELGTFTAISFPVVGIPMTIAMGFALNGLLNKLEKDTGTDIDALLRPGLAPKAKAEKAS